MGGNTKPLEPEKIVTLPYGGLPILSESACMNVSNLDIYQLLKN